MFGIRSVSDFGLLQISGYLHMHNDLHIHNLGERTFGSKFIYVSHTPCTHISKVILYNIYNILNNFVAGWFMPIIPVLRRLR
jgi:hypothetical protein